MPSRSFQKLALAALVTTFVLIVVGGIVRSTDSGLGCSTSWPDCSGSLIPDFTDHHVAIEFSHRMIAGAVVILIGGMALQAYRRRSEHSGLFAPSLAAFGLVLFQAGLGAVVVKLELEAESVVLHLSAALALLALLLYINYVIRPRPEAEPVDPDTFRRARWGAGAVIALMLVGSYMSGIDGAGEAVNDWPLMGGKLVPNLGSEEMAVHFFHRALAGAVGIFLVAIMWTVIRRRAEQPEAARLARAVLGLFAVEVLIGAFNVWTDLNAVAVAAHLATGTLIWASLVSMALVASPRLREKVPVMSRGMMTYPSEQGAS